MILYRCDLCKKIVPEEKHTNLLIGNELHRSRYEICTSCANELRDKLNEKVDEEGEED